MNLPELIETYGYWAVLCGTLLQAETVLLLAGFAAHRGYLDLPTVVGVAIIGSFLANQPWFFLGRRYGQKLLLRYPRFAGPVRRAEAKLAKYNIPLILTMRFVVGMRSAVPFALGMGPITILRFEALNIGGAIFWSVSVGAGGYLFGHVLERALGDLRHYEEMLLAALALGGLIYWWISRRRAT
jgi:membrane protein DedA with SNARE-associated domain